MLDLILSSANASIPAVQPVQSAAPASEVDAFQSALERHAAAGQGPEAAGAVQPPSPPADAADRARLGLDLDGPAEASPGQNDGDMILGGLERLRGVFGAREARMAELMQGQVTGANQLMAIQMEMVNFSLLVDMSSKLTGKATQTFDTLMKG